MSYQEAMRAAGADVLHFMQFGSYQGEWYAIVRYNDETGWVSGSYGSCSGCDAFEAEFGDHYCDQVWDSELLEYRDRTELELKDYNLKLASFGKVYLDGLMTQDQAEQAASANLDWDYEAAEILAFVREHTIGATQ